MNSKNIALAALAFVLLGGAIFLAVRHFTRGSGVTEQSYFYDLSEKKLFAGPLESDPPIKGINDDQQDGVRAVVIATSGDPNDKTSHKIAYLEKYAPELIKHLAEVRSGKVEPMPSRVRDSFRMVKRLEDPEWHTVGSPEGRKIMGEWSTPGPDGRMPAVCTP